MAAIFTYGTLMCADIMGEVAGYLPSQEPGLLAGYTRYRIRGEEYPGMIPSEGGRTEGVVYLDVSRAALARLDDFEGELYERQPVGIVLKTGETLEAEAYVVKPEYRSRLEPEEWSFEAFIKNGKRAFTQSYEGYHMIAPKGEE